MSSKPGNANAYLRGRKFCAYEHASNEPMEVLRRWVKPFARSTRDCVCCISLLLKRMVG